MSLAVKALRVADAHDDDVINPRISGRVNGMLALVQAGFDAYGTTRSQSAYLTSIGVKRGLSGTQVVKRKAMNHGKTLAGPAPAQANPRSPSLRVEGGHHCIAKGVSRQCFCFQAARSLIGNTWSLPIVSPLIEDQGAHPRAADTYTLHQFWLCVPWQPSAARPVARARR